MDKDLRLFVAVPINAKLRRGFSALAAQLRVPDVKVKWVEESNYHITLKFLGATPADKLPLIKEALSETLTGFERFRMSFKKVGVFPNLKRPKVVWTGIDRGKTELATMAKAVEEALIPIGFPAENRRFKAHLTLGRVKSDKNVKLLAGNILKHENFDGGKCLVEEIHLMKSELTGKGPIYTVEESFKLINPKG